MPCRAVTDSHTAWGVASMMFDEDTRRKLSLVSAEEEVWSALHDQDAQGKSDPAGTTRYQPPLPVTCESEERRSTIEGLQSIARFVSS
jgi:hypothetical protein